MTGEPCALAHMPEVWTIRVEFHRDMTPCIVVEYPPGCGPEEFPEVAGLLEDFMTRGDVIAVPRQRRDR